MKKLLFFFLAMIISTSAFCWGNLACSRFLEVREIKSEPQKQKLILIDQAAYVFFIAGLTMGRNKHLSLGEPFIAAKSANELQRLHLIENECRENPKDAVINIAIKVYANLFYDWLKEDDNRQREWYK